MVQVFKPNSLSGYNIIKYSIRILFTLATNFYAIPAYLVWVILLWPLRILTPHLYWAIEAFLFNGLLSMVVTWLETAGYNIVECGDDISLLFREELVLLANHQSTADVPVLMAAAHSKRSVGGRMMWIMDMMFKYTNFGAVSVLRGDFFIQQGKQGRGDQLTNLQKHLMESYIPTDKKWLVIFPEGGFLRKRLKNSKKYAEKNGYPVLEHVTLPRIGALQVVLDTLSHPERVSFPMPGGRMKSPVKWLVDLTIAYPNGRPLDLHGICIGYWPACNIILYYRAYKVEDIPKDNEGLLKWVYDRFEEKEKFLQHYYKTGEIAKDIADHSRPLPRVEPHNLHHDIMGVILCHVFYLASTYLHYCLLYKPLLDLVW